MFQMKNDHYTGVNVYKELENSKKEVVFLFLVAVFSKKNRKHVLRASIELQKHSRKFGRNRKKSTRVSI